jgi:putative cell wall-binding protein
MATKTKQAKRKSKPVRKWSKKVTETSNALDLRRNVFKLSDPKKIAQSLKRSAAKSRRKKGTPYQSAMSMLNFYINRGGKNISKRQKAVLERTKNELKKSFHKNNSEKLNRYVNNY